MEQSKPKRAHTKWPWLLLLISMLPACGTQKIVQRPIVVCPNPGPLSPQLLQLTQPNSTELLKKADDWLLNSGKLLDSVTPK